MMPDNRATRPARTVGRFFVTGVGGQLGHDVVNELIGRGYTAIGSDIAPNYKILPILQTHLIRSSA